MRPWRRTGEPDDRAPRTLEPGGPSRTGAARTPFRRPPGTASVTVDLSHDGGVIDLGCHGPDGFRGWSGGARRRFTVGAEWATPGYIPGELEPGTWHAWLGLHRIPPDGVPYEVTITTSGASPRRPDDPPPPRPERPPRRDLPAPDGFRWLAGDLHSHTVHSDGTLTVHELACLAASRGLDFLAVTDHNTVSHHPELVAAGEHAGVLLLPGQEVTTDLGHANVFGLTGWVDFRRPSADWAAFARARGGLMSINHPLSGDCAWRRPLPADDRPRLAEIWHSSWWDRRWGAPLAWAEVWRPEGVVPLGGSDFHDPAQHKTLGEPVTWVLAEGEDVLGGLAAGRTSVSAAPDAPVLLRDGGELVAIGADGTVLVRPDGRRAAVRGDRVRVPADHPGMHRLETHENEVIALCG
ncbi:CehA/McbA family metallohydrolase [Actinomadura madurae]|uniref:CehA/McbA family metallohydrolase n=1 Tax=Actinomadura madurae TaxID=1993 RepID=UPI0020D23264|nr:CehA/McbA family metallohydrolase [Actinomadura madurae]MCP9965131.1 CehA/McbA family metallohydrolase [Actinomadura madurae]MCQ0010883.1 CehA/McbA family metallohydrolase [Actinomadura madurae]